MEVYSTWEDDIDELDSIGMTEEQREKLEWAIDSLNELIDNIEENHIKPEECFEKFKQTSVTLSNFLPDISDVSLHAIDDLLYPSENITVTNTSKIYTKESIAYLVKMCFKRFLMIYNWVNQKRCYHIVDTVYLQFIEHSPGNLFLAREVFDSITDSIKNRMKVCRAVKFLKLVLGTKSHEMRYISKSKYLSLTWLPKLKNIPEPKHSQKKRLASWLCRQSTCILEMLEQHKAYVEVKQTLEKLQETNFNGAYFELLMYVSRGPHIIVDHLFQYFHSAHNEEQRLQRASDFLKANLKDCVLTDWYGSWIMSWFNYYHHCLYFIDECECLNDLMILIDRRHCNDIEPYISASSNLSDNVKVSNKQPICEKLNELNCEDQPDLTIEKFLFYDDFLKTLNVMSMVHDAFLRCNEILNIDKDIEEIEGGIFRNGHSGTRRFLSKRFLCESKCGSFKPWWFQTALKKCPFLFVSKHHEHMIDDLVKTMKGEDIDEVTRERLYFAIHSHPIIDFEG